MYVVYLYFIWGAALAFTILTFYKRDVMLFPLLAGAHYILLSYSFQDVDFVFGDGLNSHTWTADIMDFTGAYALPYFFSGIGLIMFIVAFYHMWIISKQGLDKGLRGGAFDNDNL